MSSVGVVLLKDLHYVVSDGRTVIIGHFPGDVDHAVVYGAVEGRVDRCDRCGGAGSLSGRDDGLDGFDSSSVHISGVNLELVLLLRDSVLLDVGLSHGILDHLKAGSTVLFQNVLGNGGVTGSNSTLGKLIPVYGDLVTRDRHLLVLSWGVHLSRFLSDLSTVGVIVGVRPRSSSSSVSGHNSNLDHLIEVQVENRFDDLSCDSLFLVFGPQYVHVNLAVDSVEVRVVLEVLLEVALFSFLPLSKVVLKFHGVTLDARSVVSSLLERDLQATFLGLNGGFYWRNLRGNSGSLDLVGRVGERTPAPSVAASNLVVHELRGTQTFLHVYFGLSSFGRVEVDGVSNEVSPGGTVEVGDLSGAADVLDVVALNFGASVKVSTNRVPGDLDSTLLIVSRGLRVGHRLGDLLNSSATSVSVLARELTPSLGVPSSNLSLDELALILSVLAFPEGAHGKSAALLLDVFFELSITDGLVLLEDARVVGLEDDFVRSNFFLLREVNHSPAEFDLMLSREGVG